MLNLKFRIQYLPFTIGVFAIGLLNTSCHNHNLKSGQQIMGSDSLSRGNDSISSKISFYTAKLTANPNDANAYWSRGNLEMQIKSLGPALGDLTKAVMLDSTKSDYFFSLANIDFFTGHTHEAKDAFLTSIRLNPKNIDAMLQLAELYYQVRLYHEALDMVDQAIKVNPYIAREYFLKGMIFTDQHDTTIAISSMQTAIEQDPNYFLAYIQLGVLLSAKGNPMALTYFDDAMHIQPNNSEPYYDKGLFYQFAAGDYDNAIKAYNDILQLDSLYPHPDTLRKHACYNLGDIYFEDKTDYNKSLEYFNEAIKSDTAYFMGYFGRG